MSDDQPSAAGGLVAWGMVAALLLGAKPAVEAAQHAKPKPASRTLAKPATPPLGPADGDVVRLALAQADRMGASPKVKLALIEAGLVESNLRNLSYGDRDSLGYLQQRPSKGWRCPRNITCATWDFLRRAIPLEGRYPTAGQLAQAVQRSAFPHRYDRRAVEARWIIRNYSNRRS